MSDLQEPTEQDLLRFEQCLNDCHSLCSGNVVIAEVAAGDYRRKVLVNRYAIDKCLSFNENKRLAGTKTLASALMRACADPDSYNISTHISPDEVELGEKITYL